ncbi:MAG: PSD1 and planctomycete cytochrome C domain-containing protein [Gemmatales bacterium]|nr:PSD1 and planctomycete cytochrome C domain-containing protein [Gemmatales bacterium]MDW8385660.1 PSD1 and planctomycete cytochrome C domain-containing protein [Gemmatales bacterium]
MMRSSVAFTACMLSTVGCLLAVGLPRTLVVSEARAVEDLSSEPATDREGIEFFEKHVRPLLLEHCTACHGSQKQRGGLRLDSPAAIRKGGDRGAVVVAGNPEASLLIQAIRYTDQDFRMPPKGKLKDEQITVLTEWVKRGAALPRDTGSVTGGASNQFDLAERRRHWCYQPVQRPPLPQVADVGWCCNAVDVFIRARQEAAGIRPAPEADKRTLIRRLTFDLIGLPPTVAEVEAFLADDAPDAYERLVERLLASPHYGERWGRHWLDLMRYAETLGHEFDYDIHNAWRYRDYVISAFNDDLPYDQFVIEHLAGDLVERPRRDPRTGLNLSVLATGWFWLGEEKHSPVDARQQEADRMDNQIDVFGKAFLAQTLSCARCHDHKFDAISLADYYALAGFLKSSRYQQAFLDPPERIAAKAARLREIQKGLADALSELLRRDLADLPRYLEAARNHILAPKKAGLTQQAKEAGLDPARLQRWIEVLESASKSTEHPLHILATLCKCPDSEFAKAREFWRHRLDHAAKQPEADSTFRVVADFRRQDASHWFIHGDAFGSGPVEENEVTVTDQGRLQALPAGTMHSGRYAASLEGVLQSPSFTLDKRFLLLEVAGRKGRVNVVVDGLTIIRDPIYGSLTFEVKDENLHWRVVDVGMWQGRRAYLEFADSTTPGPSYSLDPKAAGRPGDAFIAVRRVLLADHAKPPSLEADPVLVRLISADDVTTFPELARRLRDEWTASLQPAPRNTPNETSALPAWLINHGLLCNPNDGRLAAGIQEHRELAASIPAPQRGVAIADGTGEDEYVFLRGNYKTPGPIVPRRLPLVFDDQPPRLVSSTGSGRLELARRLVSPGNPLLARVFVNRLWHHHFGSGLVRSTDDFGRMGELPSHPELLDYLASEFVASGWSVKAMHRLIVLSSTYRMSGRANAEAVKADPNNRLWHHMPLRRLEAEAIRDALLAVAGRLDPSMGGPSVPPYLTPFMEGRGRPSQSGPLDGAGRRSVYLAIRRNFLPPLFLAFDYPIPFTTVGRRNVSNVPSQALMLLNDAFVHEMARQLAQRLVSEVPTDPQERLTRLYQIALARPPREDEIGVAVDFLRSHPSGSGPADSLAAWTDLCHVLLNTKEFLFVP